MAELPIQYAQADDASIAYWILGEGRPAFLVHPVEISHLRRNWDVPSFRSMYGLMARDVRLIRHDPRGTGLSGPSADLTTSAFVQDMHAVLQATGSGPAAIIALTHATPLALAFAVAHPAQVACLVLLAPDLEPDRQGRFRRAFREINPETADHGFRRLLNPRNRPENEEAILAIRRENINRWRRLGVADAFLALRRRGGHDLLARVSAPTLIVHYPTRMLSDGEQAARGIPGAQLVLREGSNGPFLNPDLPGLWATMRSFILAHASETPARTASAVAPSLPEAGLTPRETEVLALVAEGLSNRVIADRLSITRGTVSRHIHNLLPKIRAANRTQATRWAIEHGLAGDRGPS